MLKVTEVPHHIEVALLIDMNIVRRFALVRDGAGGNHVGLRIAAGLFRLANRWTTPLMAETLCWARSRMRIGVVPVVP